MPVFGGILWEEAKDGSCSWKKKKEGKKGGDLLEPSHMPTTNANSQRVQSGQFTAQCCVGLQMPFEFLCS